MHGSRCFKADKQISAVGLGRGGFALQGGRARSALGAARNDPLPVLAASPGFGLSPCPGLPLHPGLAIGCGSGVALLLLLGLLGCLSWRKQKGTWLSSSLPPSLEEAPSGSHEPRIPRDAALLPTALPPAPLRVLPPLQLLPSGAPTSLPLVLLPPAFLAVLRWGRQGRNSGGSELRLLLRPKCNG